MEIKNAVSVFLEIQKQLKPIEMELNLFARKKFEEKFGKEPESTWYRHFDVVDEECIRVCYGYLEHGVKFTDSFIVKIS